MESGMHPIARWFLLSPAEQLETLSLLLDVVRAEVALINSLEGSYAA
jgi:hypothetical protein